MPFLLYIQVVLDGYSAPLTAGNFVKLVIDGKYDGVKLQSTEQAIISDNDRGDVGFSLPIEVMPAGGFEPLYRTTLSVQVCVSPTIQVERISVSPKKACDKSHSLGSRSRSLIRVTFDVPRRVSPNALYGRMVSNPSPRTVPNISMGG
eukprot:Gb_26967 [translate_table: standard]